MPPTPHRTLLPLLLLALVPLHARAVVAAKTPPSSIYGSSAAVIAGRVTAVTPGAADTTTLEAAVATLRGTPVGDAVKIRLEHAKLPAGIAARIKAGSPVVLFIGNRAGSSALHLADTWLFPQQNGANFIVAKDLEANLRQSYPGTTSALVKIVEELKANDGKYAMLDAITEASSKAMLQGGAKDLGKVDATGLTGLLTARYDKAQKLFGRTKAGLKHFELPADAGRPRPDSPPALPDPIAMSQGYYLTAAGELGSVNAAKRQLWTDNSTASAAAFGNFGEEPDKLYAIVVKGDNVFRYPLDGAGEPADFLRMTGERVTTYHTDNPKWLANATAAAIDANGDGKTDVLINTPAGPILLINRGYGAFFIDTDIAKALKTADGKPVIPDDALWTAADLNADGLDDLLIVNAGGAVTAVLNAKAADAK